MGGQMTAVDTQGQENLESALRFREALSKFPSGVTIVTTADANRKPWGFTASAFTSVSQSPPQVLVCLDRSAECYPVFEAVTEFSVNILRSHHVSLAKLFATRGADKFGSGGFHWAGDKYPVLDDALATLFCKKAEMFDGGDHSIILGTVLSATTSDGQPAVYFARQFHSIP